MRPALSEFLPAKNVRMRTSHAKSKQSLPVYRECVKITDEDDEWFCQMCENLNNA